MFDFKRMRIIFILVVFFSIFFIGFAHFVGASNTMTLRNDDTTVFTNYPVQFGRAFVQGEVPFGFYPQVLINGLAVQTQVDVKNRHSLDSSLKFAVISFVLPSLNPGQTNAIGFQNIDSATYQSTVGSVALSSTNMLNNFNFDAVMELVNPAQTHTISARAMLQDSILQPDIKKTWLAGPVVTSVVLADHSVNRVYDVGWEQQGTTLTRCTSAAGVPNPTIYQCSLLDVLFVQDASWVSVGQVLDLQDELVLVQAVNTTGQHTINVQRDYGGLPHATQVDPGYFVTSNIWQPTTQANRKSFRPVFEADFWPTLNKVHVRFIGENSNTEALQDLYYDLNLATGYLNPATVYSQTGITHHIGARWAKDFWVGGAPSKKLTIDYNRDYLVQTGFIDYYDSAVQPVPNTVANWYNCFSTGNSCNLVSINNWDTANYYLIGTQTNSVATSEQLAYLNFIKLLVDSYPHTNKYQKFGERLRPLPQSIEYAVERGIFNIANPVTMQASIWEANDGDIGIIATNSGTTQQATTIQINYADYDLSGEYILYENIVGTRMVVNPSITTDFSFNFDMQPETIRLFELVFVIQAPSGLSASLV